MKFWRYDLFAFSSMDFFSVTIRLCHSSSFFFLVGGQLKFWVLNQAERKLGLARLDTS
jgi:hypothetical protein